MKPLVNSGGVGIQQNLGDEAKWLVNPQTRSPRRGPMMIRADFHHSHSIHGTGIFPDPSMVDFYSKCKEIYGNISYMDPMGQVSLNQDGY